MEKRKALQLNSIDLINNKTGDKVRVVDFEVSPKTPIPGELLKIKFRVENVGNSKLKLVPWRIVNNKEILYSGYRFNLPSGSSFEVTATWQAVKGNHFFYADIDPQNILNEPKSKQYDNFPQGVDVIVGR